MKKIGEGFTPKNSKIKSEDLDTRIDDYKFILNTINSWIVSADNKVSIYCGMYSVVIAAITFAANHLLSGLNAASDGMDQLAYTIFTWCVALDIIAFLISIVFYTASVKPDLLGEKCSKKEEMIEYSLFYANIAKFQGTDDFMGTVKKASRKDYYHELLKEVYSNSKVCTNKMKRFQIAVIASAASVFLTVAACIAYYFSYCGII